MRLLEVPDCAQCVICQVYTDTICEVPAKTIKSIQKYLQTQTHIPTEPPDTNTYTFRYLKTQTPVSTGKYRRKHLYLQKPTNTHIAIPTGTSIQKHIYNCNVYNTCTKTLTPLYTIQEEARDQLLEPCQHVCICG